MARKTTTKALALPPQAQQDVKTIAKIMDRWAVGVEDVSKEVFTWAKKHKFLILLGVGIVAFYRYWLMEPEQTTEEESF